MSLPDAQDATQLVREFKVNNMSTGHHELENPADGFFERNFKALTGYTPMRWQTRLFQDHFLAGDLPDAVSIPTGLGKTAVMAVWLIALAWQMRYAPALTLPRRMVYVVDRRVVVDQATEFAETLRANLVQPQAAELRAALFLEERELPISTLRGKFVDNRQWLDDPARSAIIVGTVDMIGSRLLFGGYGVSPKMRPYHAGLLGVDALIILDEAHLVPPFESLLAAIDGEPQRYCATSEVDRALVPPFQLLSLSATGRERAGEVFHLVGSVEEPKGRRGDLDDDIAVERLSARKAVSFVEAGSSELSEALAEQAWRLTDEGRLPLRCLVFSHIREVAEKAQELVQKRLGAEHKANTELLVGARRVREREDAKQRLEVLGFLAGKPVPREKPVFLFATSAGEVGIDLDADHMVCDLVEWERMAQRLGRVNRRGEGDAKVRVVLDSLPKAVSDALARSDTSRTDKDRKILGQHEDRVLHRSAMKAPFEGLVSTAEGRFDASPGALRQLSIRAETDPTLKQAIVAATTPAPLRPALTRAVVDAWAMTSLEEHTGRPDIEPWLRGWVNDRPQTTLVWRTHLPVRSDGVAASKRDVEDFFEAAPPHVSEGLETEAYRVLQWLVKRCEAFPPEERERDEPAVPPLRRSDTLGFVLSGANKLREVLRVAEFLGDAAKEEAKRIEATLAGTVLVLDARVGGLAMGLLNEQADEVPLTADAGASWGLADDGQPLVRFRVRDADPADADPNWSERFRFATQRDDEGANERWLFVDRWRGDSANERDRAIARTPQLLHEHQSWAERKARQLAQRLGLGSPWADVLALAARLHDEGKRAERWQRAFKAPRGAIYAKTRGPISQQLLDGYRHEFGSLSYAERDEEFKRLPDDLKDMVLHLIAAHHGQARPVIGTRSCEDAAPPALTERARDVAMRFARLHERWGPWGLVWWESLLRAADQQASREHDERKEGI